MDDVTVFSPNSAGRWYVKWRTGAKTPFPTEWFPAAAQHWLNMEYLEQVVAIPFGDTVAWLNPETPQTRVRGLLSRWWCALWGHSVRWRLEANDTPVPGTVYCARCVRLVQL